jgi:pilus assembly protein Flp/PilA
MIRCFLAAFNRPGSKPMQLFHRFSRLFRDDSGATAIEYGLIAALIAVAAIGAFTAVGSSLTGIFNTVAGDL